MRRRMRGRRAGCLSRREKKEADRESALFLSASLPSASSMRTSLFPSLPLSVTTSESLPLIQTPYRSFSKLYFLRKLICGYVYEMERA